MPLAVSIIVLFVTAFLYGKKYKASLICFSIIGYFGLLFLSSYKGGDVSEYDGVNRIVAGLTSFTQAKKEKDEDHSTVRLSSKLLDSYFWQSPIIGNGRAVLGENAYTINDHVSDLELIKADAHLAYMLVEYGFIGVLIYFVFFTKIFKYLTKFDINRKKAIIFLLFFTILSITEAGLWDANLFPYVFLYFMSINKQKFITYRKRKKYHILSK